MTAGRVGLLAVAGCHLGYALVLRPPYPYADLVPGWPWLNEALAILAAAVLVLFALRPSRAGFVAVVATTSALAASRFAVLTMLAVPPGWPHAFTWVAVAATTSSTAWLVLTCGPDADG